MGSKPNEGRNAGQRKILLSSILACSKHSVARAHTDGYESQESGRKSYKLPYLLEDQGKPKAVV